MTSREEYESYDWWRAEHVRQRFGISQMALHRWLKDERVNFPRPIVISGRRYWKRTDILAWEQRCSTNETARPGRKDLLDAREAKQSKWRDKVAEWKPSR